MLTLPVHQYRAVFGALHEKREMLIQFVEEADRLCGELELLAGCLKHHVRNDELRRNCYG